MSWADNGLCKTQKNHPVVGVVLFSRFERIDNMFCVNPILL